MLTVAATLLLTCVPVDGDTVDCERIGRVRLIGIDTAEIHGACDYERNLARSARAFTAAFVSRPVLVEHDGRRDRYGRILAHVSRDGRDLGAELIRAGLARVWAGRREGWCTP